MKYSLSATLRNLGPGLITAALVLGPGSLTITTKLGAEFGFQLLWVVPVMMVFMIAYTRMSARIGLANRQSLIELIRQRYGSVATMLLGIGMFGITVSFQAGNAIGSGLALAELTGTSTPPWVIFFTLLAIALLFFRSFYQILEKIMIGMVMIMVLSFLITLGLSRPDPGFLAAGLVPNIPKGAALLTVALVASSFSVVAAFYQAYLVQEKGWGPEDMATAGSESRNGIITLGLLSAMIMICAAAVLQPQNIRVNAASDLGLALEPLFGRFASMAFLIGFFAASFSSLIGNATIGGGLLSDAFGQGRQLSSPKVRLFIIGVIVIGAAIALAFGALPLQLIIFAQSLTVTVAPFAAVFILLIANDPEIMGKAVHTRRRNILPLLGLGVLLLLAGYYITSIFF